MHTAGFTAAVCSFCGTTDPGLSVLDALRAAVRRCPHGVLISAGCLLDDVSCAGRTDGVMVLVQLCSADRTPTSPAWWIGPINSAVEAAKLCDWLEDGVWDTDHLPVRWRTGMGPIADRGSVRLRTPW